MLAEHPATDDSELQSALVIVARPRMPKTDPLLLVQPSQLNGLGCPLACAPVQAVGAFITTSNGGSPGTDVSVAPFGVIRPEAR